MDLSLVDQGDILRLRRESIGFVFQDAFLINEFSLRDNVELPLVLQGVNTSERRQIVDNTLSEFGLLDQAKKSPHELSGGQVQRGAVARALVNNPSLVLADEPTGSLDRENGRIVMTSLSRAARDRNATVILVSHDEEALSYCDRTIELLDGVIIE
jgi:putative ABC transport system ATP-binding protein